MTDTGVIFQERMKDGSWTDISLHDYVALVAHTPSTVRVVPANHQTYHDLYITTPTIPRTRISNLPYGIIVHCLRTCGWEVWQGSTLLGAEYGDSEHWLVLDVAGHEIINSRDKNNEDQ